MSEEKNYFPQPFFLNFPMETVISYYKTNLAKANKISRAQYIKMMKFYGERDLFFLMVFILDRPDMIHPWLYARCREFQKDPNGNLDLWAREHYKSTIITFGGCIFEIILDPETTIGIFSHTNPIAKAFLTQIKKELENNELLKEIWSDIFYESPRRQSPKWSEVDGITVKRKGNPKEATIEASGLVDGQPTSKHYKVRVYDDVVTLESVNTSDQIKKTTLAWQMSDNLGATGGCERYIGTRYHLFDTYRTMMDSDVVKVREHPCTVDGKEHGSPVLLTPEALLKKRRVQGIYVFGSQMLLDPVADSAQGFSESWITYASVTKAQADSLNIYIIVDPSSGKKKDGGDYTAMVVMGIGADSKWHLLGGIRDRLNLTQRQEALFELHKYWKPLKVGYEEYGLQADIEFIEFMQAQENYRFEITPLGGNKLKKEDRILKLVPLFETGRLLIPPTMPYRPKDDSGMIDLISVFIEEEYVPFPIGNHDDFLDAMARIEDPQLEVQIPIESSKITPRGYTYEDSIGVGSSSSHDNGDWITG